MFGKILSFRAPIELDRAVDKAAGRLLQSKSDFVRVAVLEKLKREA